MTIDIQYKPLLKTPCWHALTNYFRSIDNLSEIRIGVIKLNGREKHVKQWSPDVLKEKKAQLGEFQEPVKLFAALVVLSYTVISTLASLSLSISNLALGGYSFKYLIDSSKKLASLQTEFAEQYIISVQKFLVSKPTDVVATEKKTKLIQSFEKIKEAQRLRLSGAHAHKR